MRPRIAVAILALLAGVPVQAAHNSVGGDVSAEFPPAREYLLPSARDVDALFEYDNSGSDEHLFFDRVSPPDQSYRPSPVGYFDVVAVHYAGAFDVTARDYAAWALQGTPAHFMTVSYNVYADPPPWSEVNWVVPGEVDTSGSGNLYPTFVTFYAYLFGEGGGMGDLDGDGEVDDPYMAGAGPFEDLVDAEACLPRATKRCQLLATEDLANVVWDDQMQPAVCGWSPTHHFHPSASVEGCRDFDFRYASDDSGDPDQPRRQASPFWLQAATPGWYANIFIQMPTRAPHWASEDWPFHFTVGAAFDPELAANGALLDPSTGQSALSCIEPGFDTANYVAHDLDVYTPPSRTIDTLQASIDEAHAIAVGVVSQSGIRSTPVGDEWAATWSAANATTAHRPKATDDPRTFEVEPTDNAAVFADDHVPPRFPTDTHGAIQRDTGTEYACIDPATGSPDPVDGKVVDIKPAWRNWLEAEVRQDLSVAVAPPLRLVDLNNEPGGHDGGGATFYFGDPRHRPALAEWSTELDTVPLEHALEDAGPGCTWASDPAFACVGDEMYARGYRPPTVLVWVAQLTGPVVLHDWRLDAGVWIAHATPGTHCVIGASRGTIDGDGNLTENAYTLDVLARHLRPGTAVPWFDMEAARESLRGALCPDAETIDLFPGNGFVRDPDGGSVDNPFGWTVPTASVDAHSARIDLYYLVTVRDDFPWLSGDKLELHDPGWPTVIDTEYAGTTHLWRHTSVVGEGIGA